MRASGTDIGVSQLDGVREAYQSFLYISPLSRFAFMHQNAETAERLRYSQVRNRDANLIEDIWDGSHIARLKEPNISWAGREENPPRRYFAEATDMALGFAADGIPLFNRSPVDCWPLLLINYSLPAHMRNRREHQLCCGLIPGMYTSKKTACPRFDNRNFTGKKEKRRGPVPAGGVIDIDSFLRPLVDDLRILATEGIRCSRWDPINYSMRGFTLRAHLVVVIGDMPAISKVIHLLPLKFKSRGTQAHTPIFQLMHFKGLNSKVPCRCCTQPAVLSFSNKHYYLVAATRGQLTDYTHLPLRDEVETKLTGAWIGATAACSARDEIANTVGISDEVSQHCFSTARFHVHSPSLSRLCYR